MPKIEVVNFNSHYKARPENVQLIASHKCINQYTSKENKNIFVGGALLDSSGLINRFDLSQNNSFPIQIEISDVSYMEMYKNSPSAEIQISLVDCPDELGRDLSIPLYSSSPIKSLFTPELYPKIFGGMRQRKSQYSELLHKLRKKDNYLIFDAILDYKTYPGNQIGEGLITISVMIPNCNDLIRYLSDTNAI